MSVDHDDSFYESESDDEYQWLNESNYSFESEEMDYEDDQEVVEEARQPTSKEIHPGREEQLRYHKERMKELDEDIKYHIRELHQYMSKGGLADSAELLEKCFDTETGRPRGKTKLQPNKSPANKGMVKNVNHNSNVIKLLDNSQSAETIYRNAVEKRTSSSSEDDVMELSGEDFDKIFKGSFHTDIQSSSKQPGVKERNSRSVEPQLHSSGQQQQQPDKSNAGTTDDSRGQQIVRDAEMAKAKIFNSTGECISENYNISPKPISYHSIAQIDQEYLLVGNHVDESTQLKIVKGDYVDFGKLLPKDKVLAEEDGRLELVVRNGKTFWTPIVESVNITSFSKWEQAFRIYSDIYNRAHPHKSTELIQYNHVIHSISLTYVWDNVYAYDKEFCIHMSKHPERNWGVILQQAWSMKLRDRLIGGNNGNSSFANSFHSRQSGGGHGAQGEAKSKSGERCHKFNKGKCKFGTLCRYNHRCSYCFKFGHNILTCRKLVADRERVASAKKESKGGHDKIE